MKKTPFELLILQSTSLCNCDCKYCYLPDKLANDTFDISLIPHLFNNLKESNLIDKDIKISWHAGEPLILPIAYYRKAFDLIIEQTKGICKVANSFQTNGTLITQEYCDFIKEYGVNIGISIDGPEFINDKNRVDKKGNGIFNRIIKGIRLLQKNNIEFSVISVITDFTLDYPDEMFDFYNSIGVKSLGFNVEEIEGINKKSSFQKENIEERYKQFIYRFYSLVKTKKTKIQLREYKRIVNFILTPFGYIKNGLVTPLNTITVDANGNYTVFAPELLTVKNEQYGDFLFGNVKNDLFSNLESNSKFVSVFNEIQKGVTLCKNECDYFNLCLGGPPSNKLQENGSFNSTETIYCKYNTKILTDIVLEDIEDIISENK